MLAHGQGARLAEQCGDLLDERLPEIVDVAPPAEPLDQLVGRGHAHVGRDQRLLERLPRLVVARVEAPNRQSDRGARPTERAAQPSEEASSLLRLVGVVLVAEQL